MATMSSRCKRCQKKNPNKYALPEGWAAPLFGWVMCPQCYSGLQAIREEWNRKSDEAIHKYMRMKAKL